MTKFRVLGSNIAIKRLKPKEITEGGIIIPASAQKYSASGEIIAIGPGRFIEKRKDSAPPFSAKIGDIVLVRNNTGTEVEIDGEEILIIESEDVLVILDE